MRRGNFVWCNFPYDEEKLVPGPEPHIVYVFDTQRSRDGAVYVDCIFTTSKGWTRSDKPPFWIIAIDGENAKALEQKPFTIDATRVARIPMTQPWFPKLLEHDRGVLKCGANKTLQDRILDALENVARRPGLTKARENAVPERHERSGSTSRGGGRGR